MGAVLEAPDGVAQRLDSLLAEENARRRLLATEGNDRLQRAAGGVGDDGAARRHRLERHDTEILETGEEQCPAVAVEVGGLHVVPPAQELDSAPRPCPQLL